METSYPALSSIQYILCKTVNFKLEHSNESNDKHRISVLGTHGRLSKPVEVGNEYDVEITDRGKSVRPMELPKFKD